MNWIRETFIEMVSLDYLRTTFDTVLHLVGGTSLLALLTERPGVTACTGGASPIAPIDSEQSFLVVLIKGKRHDIVSSLQSSWRDTSILGYAIDIISTGFDSVFIGAFVDAIDIDERIKSRVAASMSQRDKQERNQEHHPSFLDLVFVC